MVHFTLFLSPLDLSTKTLTLYVFKDIGAGLGLKRHLIKCRNSSRIGYCRGPSKYTSAKIPIADFLLHFRRSHMYILTGPFSLSTDVRPKNFGMLHSFGVACPKICLISHMPHKSCSLLDIKFHTFLDWNLAFRISRDQQFFFNKFTCPRGTHGSGWCVAPHRYTATEN